MADLVPIEYVSYMLGISTNTLNVWYRWKQKAPEQYEEFGHELPDYIQDGNRGKRFWHERDIKKLKKFQAALPRGRSGILGDITQITFRRKKEESKNGKKSSSRSKTEG